MRFFQVFYIIKAQLKPKIVLLFKIFSLDFLALIFKDVMALR
jgi:hypothetical protein